MCDQVDVLAAYAGTPEVMAILARAQEDNDVEVRSKSFEDERLH